MPTGDDLVEVLLDPTNGGSDSSDLYHLVFKSHGTIWAEKGIDTPRPIGLRSALGMIPYATAGAGSGDWTVEVKIPLAIFGMDARKNSVWGINVTRYTRATGGYYNWSGASRYCYNPQTLGNLLLAN